MHLRYANSTAQLFSEQLAGVRHSDELSDMPHLLLYGRVPNGISAMINEITCAMSMCGGGNECAHTTPTTPNTSTSTTVTRVFVPDSKKRVDVVYSHNARGVYLDVRENDKVLDGVTAFIRDVTSTQDVASAKRLLVITNAHALDKVTQMALRQIVEKASFTTWIVMSVDSTGRIDSSLLSRFVCMNTTPLYNATGAENENARGKERQLSEIASRTLARLHRIETCYQIGTTKVPRAALDQGMAAFFLEMFRQACDDISRHVPNEDEDGKREEICRTLLKSLCAVQHASAVAENHGCLCKMGGGGGTGLPVQHQVLLSTALAEIKMAMCAAKSTA